MGLFGKLSKLNINTDVWLHEIFQSDHLSNHHPDQHIHFQPRGGVSLPPPPSHCPSLKVTSVLTCGSMRLHELVLPIFEHYVNGITE